MRTSISRLIKKILWVVFIVWCSGIFLNWFVGVSEVNAQGAQIPELTASNATASDTSAVRHSLNVLLKLVYLLIWPLLVVAGLAMDNTLVYASIFHLDAPLRQFWNMMKNFANFTLGFMVLIAIIKSLFTGSWAWSLKDEKSPLGVIKSTLIAGILIQASRFLLAALIDLSTVATYAVGWLPLSILQTTNTSISNQKIIPTNGKIDMNKFSATSKDADAFQIRYSLTLSGNTASTLQISPCRVERSYIIGRLYPDQIYNNISKLSARGLAAWSEVCVLDGNQLVVWNDDQVREDLKDLCTDCRIDMPEKYTARLSSLMLITWVWESLRTQDMIPLDGSSTMMGAFADWTGLLDKSIATTISDLINRSKGFVWPLVTLYSSLLNFSQLSTATVTSASGTAFIFIIKSLVALALFFPLVALALVLIARVWVLRLYIVSSPFIILLATFKKSLNIKAISDNKYLNISGVIGIIFAPVVSVAALSISLIFMTALVNGFTAPDTKDAIHESMGVTVIQNTATNTETVDFEWVKLEFSKVTRWSTMDWLSWMMVNFFAIGLMRMIFFASMQANELGKAIGGKVESIWKNVLGTLPILPGPAGVEWWVGIGSAFNALKWAPDKRIANREYKQDKIVNEFLWLDTGTTGTTPPTTLTTDQAKTIITSSTVTSTDIQSQVQNLWVATTGVGTFLAWSTDSLYQAINALNVSQPEKDKLITTVITASNNQLSTDWYTTAETKQKTTTAKADLDTIAKDVTDGTALQTLFNTANSDHKKKIDAYFAIQGTTEVETIAKDGKTYKISKPTSTPPTYTVTLKS